eukprot:CAMPEP_0197008360 /NCGR_PEP_ID=MMETSP1380-20130617/44920_1 /TAXON_ID=5936 /ORGANISM="Euplotes crassus, Strain CT5" /LENGTH=90 /DNA_ID=CAMNT_0042428921 /DNA_START=337 /DNA_END=609 /DNA_ORIENTATION=-
MHDEAKHDKKLETILKDKDFAQVETNLNEISSNLFLISGKLSEGEEHMSKFNQLQGSYHSNSNYLAFFVIFAVTLTGVIEILLFKNRMVK